MWRSLFWCKMRRAEGEDPRTATDGPQWRSQVVNFLLGTSVSLSICHILRGEALVSVECGHLSLPVMRQEVMDCAPAFDIHNAAHVMWALMKGRKRIVNAN